MILATLTLLLQSPSAPAPAAKPTAEPRSDAIVVRVPQTFLHVRLEVPGFKSDPRDLRVAMPLLAHKAVLIGSVRAIATNVILLGEPEGEIHLTGAERREKHLANDDSDAQRFEVAGIACSEARLMADRSYGVHDLHAWVVAGGFAFDLQLSTSIEPGKADRLERAFFEGVVRSFRLAFLRRGGWDDLPSEVLELMNDAALRMPAWIEWMDELAGSRAEDWVVHFVKAEALKHRRAPEAMQAASFERAIALLDARQQPPKAERFARVLAEDGLGLALADMDRVEDSIPHFRKGYEIAQGLAAPARAGLAYNLSCSYARIPDADRAIEFLKLSIAADGSYQKRASEDGDDAKIRDHKGFQALLRGDAAGQ